MKCANYLMAELKDIQDQSFFRAKRSERERWRQRKTGGRVEKNSVSYPTVSIWKLACPRRWREPEDHALDAKTPSPIFLRSFSSSMLISIMMLDERRSYLVLLQTDLSCRRRERWKTVRQPRAPHHQRSALQLRPRSLLIKQWNIDYTLYPAALEAD